MSNPIQITDPRNRILDGMSLNIFAEEVSYEDQMNQVYTEAVFSKGKASIEPMANAIQAVKDKLSKEIADQEASAKEIGEWSKTPKGERRGPVPKRRNFDPIAFWKDPVWRDLENNIAKIFGFRAVNIEPYKEKYDAKHGDFQSRELNAFVYSKDRYPIEALVTDEGLYDKSHSIFLDMRISLGLINALTAEEITGVALHEIGHGIDPALVNIRFLETNILSKYITDRKNKINKDEEKAMKKHKFSGLGILIIGYICIIGTAFLPQIIKGIQRLIMGKEKYEEKQKRDKLNLIKDVLNNDQRQFNRQTYSEAFADNFARMYGYGAQLMSGLRKIETSQSNELKSRIKKESTRQEMITQITISLLDDVHKTDIHRTRALLREYDNDIKDPNIPEAVKKQLQDDKAELEKVLDEYLNNFDDFQNRVNRMINEELIKLDDKIERKKEKEVIKESTEVGKETDNSICQTVLDSILSLNIPEWDKLIFYAQYDEDSYEMKFYVKRGGIYKDCFSLGISTNRIVDFFSKLDREICKSRERFLKENKVIWNVMTIIIEPTMHFKTEFDYSEIEDCISYKSEWKKKYLI